MGGWTGKGKDTIRWDGTIESKRINIENGTTQDTPTNDKDIVNKKFVDDNSYTDADADARVDLKIEDGDAAGQMAWWNGTQWKHSSISAGKKIYWWDTLGRLGLGTDDPQSILHIQSNSEAFQINASVGGSPFFSIKENGATQFRFYAKFPQDELLLLTNIGVGRQWVFADYATREKDHDHDAETDPAMYIQSATNPDTDNTQYLKIQHNKTDAVLTPGKGIVRIAGVIASATSTFSTTGPTDNVDVSGVNTLFIEATSNAVTIGGFSGGVNGQRLAVVRCCASANNVTLEHNEGGGSQDIFLHAGADETLFTEYGGWDLICNGSDWFDISHAKHV